MGYPGPCGLDAADGAGQIWPGEAGMTAAKRAGGAGNLAVQPAHRKVTAPAHGERRVMAARNCPDNYPPQYYRDKEARDGG